MKIAIVAQNFEWAGGLEFLRFICNGLASRPSASKDDIALLLPVANRLDEPLDALRVVKRSIEGSLQRRRPWWAAPKPAFEQSALDYFKHVLTDRLEFVHHEASIRGLNACLRRLSADVALPVNGSLGPRSEVPWIGYLFDFQHRHLPGNFSVRDCYQRDINFATILRDAGVVMVNSRAVKDDVQRFYPWADLKQIVALPFAPSALPGWFDALPDGALEKYGLPERYFLISNQFWVHKDHPTAVKALDLLSQDSSIGLVCTGAAVDYRRAEYIQEVEQLVDRLGLSNRVRFLGHIPKRDQIEIMKQAVGVVQPTRFEGGPGGGSVYDAVALGVPVIMSGIPVNREVSGDNVSFFEVGEAESLAQRMQELLVSTVTRASAEVLQRRSADAMRQLGHALDAAIDLAQMSPTGGHVRRHA